MVLFDYPRNAAFNKVLPKNKIYEKASPSPATKQLFIQQIEQIAWRYKLAPETVHLPATRAVPEVQIFTIALREKELNYEVLQCIDQAIPFPILYELYFEGQVQVVAAYKRPSITGNLKWLASGYFESGWLPIDAPRMPLPIALHLEMLYANLLSPLLPYPAHAEEGLQNHIERIECILTKQRELTKCLSRLSKEKQFNRKVAINAEVRVIKQIINNFKGFL